MAKRRKVGNLLALALLSLLGQQPMYPYEMAQTLRARGKDQSLKINWGSLYTVVQNLEKNGFIEAVATEREGRQPERTTYQITEAGQGRAGRLAPRDSSPSRSGCRPRSRRPCPKRAAGPDELLGLLQSGSRPSTARTRACGASWTSWSGSAPALLIELEY